MQDAVVPAPQIGFEPRQAVGQRGEEFIVEPPHPDLGLADDQGPLPARPRHHLEVGEDVDDPDPLDEIALHRARQRDLEAAGDEVDEDRQLAVHLGGGELEIVAADELGSKRQPALDLGPSEDRAGDIADPGDRPRAEAERHAHRPRAQPARAFRAHIDEAGVVELHLRRGQAVRIIGAVESAVERPYEPDIPARACR